ncbi:hypothetical protein GJ496_000409 [Pomphorhynchus laevis]|nr:hypothetical protein GJ496_000409 [Pomphorhynchus laevis]
MKTSLSTTYQIKTSLAMGDVRCTGKNHFDNKKLRARCLCFCDFVSAFSGLLRKWTRPMVSLFGAAATAFDLFEKIQNDNLNKARFSERAFAAPSRYVAARL